MRRPFKPVPAENGYPSSDGKPAAETDWHRNLMAALIETLKIRYDSQSSVYVSGNILLFYEEGNRRRYVSPDVFVVKGVPAHNRLNYLLWQEGKGPDLVIELTSPSTRRKDTHHKYRLYQDVLRVEEYFLFDPLDDYLKPPLQGYRLRKGQYRPIRPVRERLPSQMLQLHLERNERKLRLYDPATGRWLLTYLELATQADPERPRTEAQRQQAEMERQQLERENEHLRREIAELRRRLTNHPGPS